MGGVNSCWLPRYRNPNICKENHTSTPKLKGNHRRNLSAAFNLAEVDSGNSNVNVELLNINTATEEELMTLPEVRITNIGGRITMTNLQNIKMEFGAQLYSTTL